MITTVDLPQVGESVTEGVIGKWLVSPGQWVDRYDPIVEVVTDKVSMEIPSPFAGVFIKALVEEGEVVPMGSPICEIEDQNAITQDDEKTPPSKFEFMDSVRSVGPTGSGEGGEGRRDALQESMQPEHQLPHTYQEVASAQDRKKVISPLVAKIAMQNNIDVANLIGSGIGGRVTKKDIEDYISEKETALGLPNQNEEPETSKIHISAIRRSIADHMSRSASEIPSAWSMVELDVTGLVELRSKLRGQFESENKVSLTFMPFWIQLVCSALKSNPRMNGRWDKDEIVINKRVNLGIAISTDEGLIVPVIHNADDLNIREIAMELNRLIKSAKSGSLALSDVQGGTFTLNNTGALGSIASVPIINHPQSAILTTEAIVKRPVVLTGDVIGIRSIMNMCISFDHRVCDGAEASAFLDEIKSLVENISELTIKI